MGTSPNRSYPYPAGSDAVDVPGDMEALADAVDTDMAAVIAGTGLADGAVTTAKIADGAVTLAKSSGLLATVYPSPKPAANQYVGQAGTPGIKTFGRGTLSFAAVFLWAGTIDRIACEVTTAVADCAIRMGIYAADANGNPTGSPLVDAGSADASTTGIKEITLSPAVTIPTTGVYYFALVAQGGASNPNLRIVSGIQQQRTTVLARAMGEEVGRNQPIKSSVSGALPAATSVSYIGTHSPRMAVRYASVS